MSTRIKFCHLDWRTNIHWNVVLAIFQHYNICWDCWKIPDQQMSVWLCSNPGDKVQIIVESTGQVCPVVLHLVWTLSPVFENNHTFKCWSGIFPTILTYMIMLENYQKKHFSVLLFSIPGDKILFLLTFNEARISEWNLYFCMFLHIVCNFFCYFLRIFFKANFQK